jgi:hypothetical protein
MTRLGVTLKMRFNIPVWSLEPEERLCVSFFMLTLLKHLQTTVLSSHTKESCGQKISSKMRDKCRPDPKPLGCGRGVQ